MVQIATASYWTDIAMPSFGRLDRDVDVDSVVVGAGITGLTTAYLLKRAGRRVAVLERGRIGGVDTMATTAHVTCVTDLDLTELVATFGRDHAQAVWDAGFAAIDQIDAIVGEESIDCGWTRVTGYKHAAHGADLAREAEALREEARLAHELGFKAEYQQEVPVFGTPGVAFADQAKLHPAKYVARLASLVHGDGSFVFEGSACDEVLSDSRGVKSGSFVVRAKHVVLATHTPLMGRTNLVSATLLQTKLYLYTSYVIGGRLPAGSMPEGLFWDRSDPYRYLRVDRAGEHDYIIYGGEDHKTGQASDPRQCFERLASSAVKLFPGLDVTHEWSGQVIETNDGLPYIGETAAGQFAATGFAGNGTTFGTLAAMMARDAALGLKNPWSELYDVGRTKIVGGAWDYAKENVDYPYYLVKGWLSRPEGRSLRDLRTGEGKILELSGQSVAASRDANGRVSLVSPVCTHMGCIVGWNAAERTWDCPCHGSRFLADGRVLSGPAEAPLERVAPETQRK
jgi:glycine/D-amino acid oxidase-like deaminating enzyme/nitrite reductase/ring-hydroxylating ferredoxin subunit